MDIEVKRMSPETFKLLEQLSIVCKRYGVNYSTAPECQRELMDCIALHEYQLNKAHQQGLTRPGAQQCAPGRLVCSDVLGGLLTASGRTPARRSGPGRAGAGRR